MFTHYRTQGFILKKVDSGESDRIFTIYTKDFGKLELLAKAERKIKSKLRGGLELFYLSEIEFIQGKTHKTLTDAILINNFKNLRKSLKRLAIAYKISETLDNLVKGQEPDPQIWQLLNETFKKLNNSKLLATNYQLLLYFYFFWNLLSILGYKPELHNCSICQKKLTPQNIYFNPKEGGLICQNCFKKVKLVEEDKSSSSATELSRSESEESKLSSSPFAIARESEGEKEINIETIKILRLILKKDWQTISKLKIDKSYLKPLDIISEDWYSYIRNISSI